MHAHSPVRFWFVCLVLCVTSAVPFASWPPQETAIERGVALVEQGRYLEARDVFTQVIAENPKNARAYRERAVCLAHLGDARGALADSDKAIALEPRNVVSWSGRATVKRRLKDLDGAWADLAKAIEIAPRYAPAYNTRGLLRYDRGDYTGAIVDYERSIELNPKQSSAFNNRGLARLRLEDLAGALADYTRAIENNPRNAVAYANRASCRTKMGETAAAREDYRKALAINPNYALAQERLKNLEAPASPAASSPVRDAVEFDLDLRDPIAAGASTDVTVGAIRVSLPLDWKQSTAGAAAGKRSTEFRPGNAAAQSAVVRIDEDAAPYADTRELQQIVARREAAIVEQNPGVTPRRDEVMLAGIPVTRWSWATKDNRTFFEYAVRNAANVFTVRAEAAGAVKVEPQGVRDVLETLTVGGMAVDPDLESGSSAGARGSAGAEEDTEGSEPPAWTLDKEASARITAPCGAAGEPATEPPLPPGTSAAPPDLENLQTTLAQSIDRLNRTQYAGAVSAAMQATRLLLGPLTPDQERRVFAAWAPLFDYPTDAVMAYLDELNPLLVEFIALMRGAEAAEAGLEQAQYEAEMAAAYEKEAATREAMATAMRFVAELRSYKTRIGDLAARVAALGEPPDPMKDKCAARTRTKRAVEFLETLPPPKTTPPEETPSGDDPPPEFLAKIPPSERPAYKGKGYKYWLTLPTRITPDAYSIQMDALFHIEEKIHGLDGFSFSVAAGKSDLRWSGSAFTFTFTDPLYGSWKCPGPPQVPRAAHNVVKGTISEDGKTLVRLEVSSTYRTCRTICTHGSERINPRTGEHNHRLSGEDTASIPDEEERHREIVNLRLTGPMPMVYGAGRRGATLEYSVRGPVTRDHVRALAPYPPAAFDATDSVTVRISSVEPTGPRPPVSRTVISARDEQIAIHQENIRLLEEDLARYSDLLSRAKDEDSRTFYQYVITSKGADLQAEKDAITTIETGNFTRTMTSWDAMVQGQMAAQSRETAAKTAAGASIYEHVDRLIDHLPEAEHARMRRWARDQIYGPGDRAENARRVGRSIAEQVRDANKAAASASLREAAWNDDVVANLEAIQTVANYSMYATPFVSGGGALALAYGMLSGTVSGYQTGGHLGPEQAGSVGATTLAAVTTAARYWSPAIDYSLTFFEGYTAVDESGQQAGVTGAVSNVAETFVKRKIVGTVTKAVVARQARLEAARKGARLDAWRDAQRRVAFQQEREAGQALVEQHNRLYNQYKDARRSGASPAQLAQLENRLMDATAAIKHAPHAKGYLKFGADGAQRAAYASTERLHTARVLRDFKRDLEADGFSLSGLRFRPIRNAGNTSPGMDLDMAVFTDLKRITVRDPKTQRVARVPLYEANTRMQEVFDRTYARHSGGRSARASWQMVTTSKNLEAYEDMTWIRIKRIGTEAGQVNALRPGVRPIDPLSALDPRYAGGAARVTEIKADEIRQQASPGRDNQNWETYRGTSKDIKTKVLPLIAERLKTKLTPAQRQQVIQRYEFFKNLSTSMDLANRDPVAAEHALKRLTGYQGAELVRMVSMGIESLGKFR